MDKDVSARDQGEGHDDGHPGGHDGYRWRSQEVERRRALELFGVLDAARRGRGAALRNTLAICMVALAAVGAMVTLGVVRQPGSGGPSVSAPLVSEVSSAVQDGDPSQREIQQVIGSFALSGLAENDEQSPAGEPNRANCDAIEGTSYQSETERLWFLTNCVDEPDPAGQQPIFAAGAGIGGIAAEQVPPPEQAQGVTAESAIAAGADYIANRSGPSYDVAAGSCNASEVGGVWLVTCESTLSGCDLAECTTWEAVCVITSGDATLLSETC